MGVSGADVFPIVPLPYGQVLFPGKTLNISPEHREDVIAIISKYYSGAIKTKTKDNAPLIACVPLCSPYISRDGKKLIEDGSKSGKAVEQLDVTTARADDLFDYGCIARIAGVKGERRGDVALVVEGMSRCKVQHIVSEKPFFEGRLKEFKDAGKLNISQVHCMLLNRLAYSRRLGSRCEGCIQPTKGAFT